MEKTTFQNLSYCQLLLKEDSLDDVTMKLDGKYCSVLKLPELEYILGTLNKFDICFFLHPYAIYLD